MHATRQRIVMTVLVLAIAGCQTSEPPASPSPTVDAGPTSTVPASAPVPTATPVPPPATTAFAAVTDTSIKGHLRLSTSLSADGLPLAGAPVAATITALDTTYQVLTLQGVVPLPTKSVIIQLGFNNQPDTGPAAVDMKIYRITYSDNGTKNRLPNSGFDSGLYRWVVYGGGTVTTPTSDRGDGRMLRLKATPTQEIVINSFGIKATPGSDFKMTIAATMPPAGSLSGYVAAIFLDKSEIWREVLKVVAGLIPSSTLTTDAAGSISADVALPAGRYTVRFEYAGDVTHAPVSAEQQITVP